MTYNRDRPFIGPAPDFVEGEEYSWKSGELFQHYYDWELLKIDERIFECNSGGIPLKHCMDVMIARKP